MFATDNGPNTPRFNGGMRGGKGSLFEGGQRVPCFIRWPGKLEAGKRVSQIAQHVDVLPTLLDLVGVPVPATPPLDGVSLAPLLKGEKVEWPERLLFEVAGRGGKDGTIIPKYPGTVRSDTHRWVRDNKQEMLFDLRNDPGEKNNIAAQQPEIAATLSKAYDAWFAAAIAPTQGKVQRFPITLGEGTELLAPYATKAERSSSGRAGTTTGPCFPHQPPPSLGISKCPGPERMKSPRYTPPKSREDRSKSPPVSKSSKHPSPPHTIRRKSSAAISFRAGRCRTRPSRH
jgi:arylsulfatase A